MEAISQEVFGTEDFQSVLDILPPSDAMVREFYNRVQALKQ